MLNSALTQVPFVCSQEKEEEKEKEKEVQSRGTD